MHVPFNSSIVVESKIMDTNYDGHAIYMMLSLINMCELVVGLGLAVPYLDWSMIGLLAHGMYSSAITLISLWIWMIYADGTQVQTSKISKLGTPFGPEEPYLSEFYDAAFMAKWYMYLVNWVVVGAFFYDIFAEQDTTTSYWSYYF